MKQFKTAQKIASRADLFSNTNLDLLKIISVTTLPFILIGFYRTLKKVCEISLGISIKDPFSEKADTAGTLVVGIGKRVYDAANSTIKLIENTIKTNHAANVTTSASSSVSLHKILSATLLPFLLFDIYRNVEKIHKVVVNESIFHLKDKFNRVTDQILSILDNCVDITQIIANFIANTTLATATGFLSAINIVIEVKKLYDSAAFYKKISVRNFSINGIDEYDFKKNFNPSDKVKGILKADGDEKEILLQEIKKQLVKCCQSNSEKIDQFAQVLLGKISLEKIESVEHVQRATKLKSIQMITCHALKALASSINIAAAAILLAVPPLAPVSYGLLGISSLISLSAFLCSNFVDRKWENAIVKAAKIIIVREWKVLKNY